MAALITLDTQKQQNGVSEAFNIQELFNARVGDEQVPFPVKFLERGKAQQFEDGLVPFMSGFVGNLDDDGKVTAETGEPVSYTGSRDDIVGLGMVKMNLPGTMFPQEGYFYGFLGLETPDHSKRVSTFSVWFHVYNGNPDMFVNKAPFRSELQKELDLADSLIAKADADIKAKLIEWEQLINDLISKGNSDLDGYNRRLTLAEENLATLLKEVHDAGLLTQAEFDAQIAIVNQNIADALEKLKGNIIVGDNITIGKQVNKSNQSAIENLKSLVDPTLFNFVFFTDSHYDQWNDPNRTGLERLNNALLMDGSVDAIIAGGDNVDGGSSLYDIVLSQHKEYIDDMFFYHNGGSDKFILKGNHDDASGRQIGYRRSGDKEFANTTSIPSEDLKRIYNNAALLNGEKRNGNSNYFYKDYPDKKIRLVGLDSNDTPDTILNSDGFLKYPGLMYMGYRQTQINWLANTALQNVPKDYTTVIVGHVHAHARMGANVNEDDIYTDHYYNIDLVDQVISDFMHGTSSTLTSTTKNWEVSVKTDFTNQGKRIMAGYIHGHQHQDNYTSDLGFNNIGITCSIGIDVKNPSDDGWAVVSVDPTKQTIQVRGFGRAATRSFNFING
ncbi:metallophosphoesterase family protein [Pediococcus pentosaceus]|uniref:metallophosphoesterase family protein n=1 Tax=Pediococcus pentosaceus TaxID=1255 RepID=UPI001E4071B6|nr:metallophosphoesterase [Pediococcus pentosaceus]MCG7196706.1 metallophosphoesterase [Pediococcus pentosaceus]MCI2396378.1 metallophosphoesterase [Pediococcus pentosaceus]